MIGSLDFAGIASVLFGAAALVTAIGALRGIKQVHKEVKTANGNTLAALADMAEGRRVQQDIPNPKERNRSQQAYVDLADKSDLKEERKPRQHD